MSAENQSPDADRNKHHRVFRAAARAICRRTLLCWLSRDPAMLVGEYIDVDMATCECGQCGFEEETNVTHRITKQTHHASVNRTSRSLMPVLGTDVFGIVKGYMAIDWRQCDCTTCKPTRAHIGPALIDHIDFQIGGQSIDRQYGEWLSIWDELTH